MTIYEIKRRTEETNPLYFTRKTMKFFGQTMKGWSVKKQIDGRYRISQPVYMDGKQTKSTSVRYFNPLTNQLERV